MSNSLVWFRNDLRALDHEPLTRACQRARASGGGVACVYVVDPVWFGKTRFGFDRMGPLRAKFLRESLVDLDRALRELGGKLLITYGCTESCLPTIADKVAAERVYCTHEVGTEEKHIERRVRQSCARRGIELCASPPNTLYDAADFPFSISDLPEVFSKFRRKVEAKVDVLPAQPAPSSVPSLEVPQSPEGAFEVASSRFYEVVELFPDAPPADSRRAIEFMGGESAGLARIDEYFFQNDCLRTYKQTRNGMLGADYSSKLSPWLAHGCLSPRKVYELVRRYENERGKNESTYWLIFELLWRDYFSFIMAKHGKSVFQVGGLRQMSLPWKVDHDRFNAWREGVTGYPLIDANMRELSATGFMSNRGRQNVASFLTKNLGIDWRMGAEWFESRLIDYDPASNYGNWNHAAGIGNDARGFRWFNTLKQAQQYDPHGDYVRHWLPELAKVPISDIHAPWKMDRAEQSRSGCTIGVDYPWPVVDLYESATHHEQLYNQA